MRRITINANNDQYQILAALKVNRQKRNKEGEVFVEGIESIKQAIKAGMEFTRIITRSMNDLSDWAKEFIRQNKDSTVIEVKKYLYDELCDKADPSEIMVTVKKRIHTLDSISTNEQPFILLFDRPGDYGNFGSIIRSADSFNVDAVFVIGHSIDIYDSKVIRSSLGSIFHEQIVQIQSIMELNAWAAGQKQRNGMKIIGTDSSGKDSLNLHELKRPIMIILGNEAKGISLSLKEMCDSIMKIPISGNVNSLNVSCAGSIFLWEVYKNGMG
jgi:23S rRNA (uridine2479-2'-O)-methyltransferase